MIFSSEDRSVVVRVERSVECVVSEGMFRSVFSALCNGLALAAEFRSVCPLAGPPAGVISVQLTELLVFSSYRSPTRPYCAHRANNNKELLI